MSGLMVFTWCLNGFTLAVSGVTMILVRQGRRMAREFDRQQANRLAELRYRFPLIGVSNPEDTDKGTP